MPGLTYDAGALIAAEANRADLWALHRRALRHRLGITVPAVVYAQVWRDGARQVNLSRLLAGCVVESFGENAARAVGRALALAGTADVVDAAVVVGAARRSDLVVTSDPDDLRHLADALGARLKLHVL